MTEVDPQIVGNRYELRSLVGEGGYGAVYRGVDRQTQQAVAVKILSRGAARDPDQIERMVREQQAMVALAGTGVVSVLDLCEMPTGQLCLVMEWLEGEDLEHHLAALEAKGEFMPLPRLLEITSSVANTLDRAHQMGIVHRDIKPANIFLTSYSGTTRVLDFGLSRMKWSKTLTQAGMVMGSPSYIAPETWRGQSKLIDHQADLYALGVVVFRALSGQLPFASTSLVEQLKLVTTAARPSLRQWRPELPRAVDAWARKALAIEAKARFKNGRALATALAEALGQARSGSSRLLPLPATLDELQGAVSSAFGAAASLLKRFASSVTSPSSPALQPTQVDLAQAEPPRVGPTPTAQPNTTPEPLNTINTSAADPSAANPDADDSEEDRKSQIGDWLSAAPLDRSKALKTGLDMLSWLKGTPTLLLGSQPSSKQAASKQASSKQARSEPAKGPEETPGPKKANTTKRKASSKRKANRARKKRTAR
jgi:serine/threonine-protein kinase